MSAELQPTRLEPMTLVQQALDKGTDPNALHRLLDFVERLQDREREQKFNEALHACRREMPVVVKTRENQHTKSLYVALEDIETQCGPVWTKHGFTPQGSMGTEAPPAGQIHYILTVRHVCGWKDQAHYYLPVDGQGAKGGGNMSGVQGGISTATYAHREAIRRYFGIVIAGQDQDGNVFINDDEMVELDNLIDQAGARKNPNFWKWLSGTDNGQPINLGTVPVSRLDDVRKWLLQEKAKKEREGKNAKG